MEVEIRKLSGNSTDEFCDLLKVFEEAFEWRNFKAPGLLHLQKVLSNPGFLVFTASANKKLIGGLTAYILERYNMESASVYVYDVAISATFRRQGIGKLLIAHLVDYCNNEGYSEVFVQAETADYHAVSFYRNTAISSQLHATHFTYTLKSSGYTREDEE